MPFQNSSPINSLEGRRIYFLIPFVVGLISLVVYWMTAFRTVTWWDNGEYALAAVTLGIAHPPGSLITTLLGWVVTLLPLGIPKIVSLNFFAGLLGALTVSLACLIAVQLVRKLENHHKENGSRSSIIIGGVAGGLILAFGETPWLYAIKFTPYILTALFTSIILLSMLKWWNTSDTKSGYFWFAIVLLLFGLDFSVHRTNLLLLPALLILDSSQAAKRNINTPTVDLWNLRICIRSRISSSGHSYRGAQSGFEYE